MHDKTAIQALAAQSLTLTGIRVKNIRMDDVSLGRTSIDGNPEDCIKVVAQDYLSASIPLVDIAKYLLQFEPDVLARAQAEIQAGKPLAPAQA